MQKLTVRQIKENTDILKSENLRSGGAIDTMQRATFGAYNRDEIPRGYDLLYSSKELQEKEINRRQYFYRKKLEFLTLIKTIEETEERNYDRIEAAYGYLKQLHNELQSMAYFGTGARDVADNFPQGEPFFKFMARQRIPQNHVDKAIYFFSNILAHGDEVVVENGLSRRQIHLMRQGGQIAAIGEVDEQVLRFANKNELDEALKEGGLGYVSKVDYAWTKVSEYSMTRLEYAIDFEEKHARETQNGFLQKMRNMFRQSGLIFEKFWEVHGWVLTYGSDHEPEAGYSLLMDRLRSSLPAKTTPMPSPEITLLLPSDKVTGRDRISAISLGQGQFSFSVNDETYPINASQFALRLD